MSEKNELLVLGHVLGTCSGWDEWDGIMSVTLYSIELNEAGKRAFDTNITNFPCLFMNLENGVFQFVDDDGKCLKQGVINAQI